MNHAYVTIFSDRGSQSKYAITTNCLLPDGEYKSVGDFTNGRDLVLGARVVMEKAMRDALQSGSGFPANEGEEILRHLNWEHGYEALRSARSEVIKFTMDEETCLLLPELVPYQFPDGAGDDSASVIWLDRLAPSYRTIGFERRLVRRGAEKSLAIIYQERDPFDFEAMASELRRDLDASGLEVNLYPGGKLVGDVTSSAPTKYEIFRQHRAVLFLGHHHRGKGGTGGGWQLTDKPEAALLMKDLQDYLRPVSHGLRGGNRIPEVIFAACCSSAWRDADDGDGRTVLYPKVFLSSGVEYFIGTWMDVVMRGPGCEQTRRILHRITYGFFSRWAEHPAGAVFHLYEAKNDCGFHPLTSLYQIYTLGSGVQERQHIEAAKEESPQPAEPVGAMLMGLGPGDQLGPYRLETELWATTYARTFWATSQGGRHLVQAPVDEWQGSAELPEKLGAAIDRLKAAQLGDGHLIPDRAEYVNVSRYGEAAGGLYVLVYDRPIDERSEDWRAQLPVSASLPDPDHFDRVLIRGFEITTLLTRLHAHQIRHGNLDHSSIVFRRRPGGGEEIVLKDSWVAQARPGRSTELRYGAPEEEAAAEGGEGLKTDCWALGVILYELATGQPPVVDDPTARPSIRAALGKTAHPVPEALERIVNQCLMPTAALRPNALIIQGRLALALACGGSYVAEFEGMLDKLIRAGHRLFAVKVDELPDLKSTLNGLAALGYPVFIAAEGRGVRNLDGKDVMPWITAEMIQEIQMQNLARDEPVPPPPHLDDVAVINADLLLSEVATQVQKQELAGLPLIIVIDGAGWLNVGPIELQLSIWRKLKRCQTESAGPVIIIADHLITLEAELARSFLWLEFPPLSLTDTFERILAFPQSFGFPVEPVDETAALELAQQFGSSSSRELNYALRLCALEHGVIDERALGLRDAQREQTARHIRGLSYIPPTKLPPMDAIGLPRELRERIEVWGATVRALLKGENVEAVPRRLVIQGPSGYGKTQLGLALGALTLRPVVRIEASRCLHGTLGVSEHDFRLALGVASNLRGAVVILDDVDRFFGVTATLANPQQAGTVARMSGIFEQWLDRLPTTTTAVLITSRPEDLPPSWQRRLEMCLDLGMRPSLNDDGGSDYRRAVFASVFRRAGLGKLASDGDVMRTLARATLRQRVRSAVAWAAPQGPLREHTVSLATGAEIENWVQEMIRLHAEQGRPETADFWLSKV